MLPTTIFWNQEHPETGCRVRVLRLEESRPGTRDHSSLFQLGDQQPPSHWAGGSNKHVLRHALRTLEVATAAIGMSQPRTIQQCCSRGILRHKLAERGSALKAPQGRHRRVSLFRHFVVRQRSLRPTQERFRLHPAVSIQDNTLLFYSLEMGHLILESSLALVQSSDLVT